MLFAWYNDKRSPPDYKLIENQMKTKIWYGNQYVGNFNCDGKKYSKIQLLKIKATILTKRVMIVLAAFCTLGWTSYLTTRFVSPVTVLAEKEVVKEVEMNTSPVMERILKCESGGTQTKNGQVLVHVNSDGSYDQGMFQINSIWNKKASELGYNLAIEKDNRAFAMYLYKTHGTEPWYSSKSCWK